MKVASFNIENLFARHRDLLGHTLEDKASLTAELDGLIYKEHKSTMDYERMRELWGRIEGQNGKRERLRAFAEYELYLLSNSRFLKDRPELGRFVYGLIEEPTLCLVAMQDISSKATLIQKVDADVLVLQEVEGQEALQLFNIHFLEGMYQGVYFGATGDLSGRGMGLMLKSGIRLKSLNSMAGPPLLSSYTNTKGYIQRYLLENDTKTTLDLLNVFLTPDLHKDWASFSDVEMESLAEMMRLYLHNGNGTSFLMGSLNVPNYSNNLKGFLEKLGLVKLNDLNRFSSNLGGLIHKEYDPLGGYGCGIPMRQQDYVLTLQKHLSTIKTTGMYCVPAVPRSKDSLPNYIEKAERTLNHVRPCLWFEIST